MSHGSMVILNGQLMPRSGARIGVDDAGFLVGDWRVRNAARRGGEAAPNRRALTRLGRSLAALGIALPWRLDELRSQVALVLEVNARRSGSSCVRITADFCDYYKREGGCVLSTAIDKYIFVIIKERFDERIRVGYTQTELVESVDQLKHDLVREALKRSGIFKQIEIDTIGDIPTSGSGLGSSSTVLVGVLNALYNHQNNPPSQRQLAEGACQIEIECLQKPIGKQDQYIVAYGGLRFITFNPDDTVDIQDVNLTNSEKRRLNQHLMLFYTNTTRSSSSILTEQNDHIHYHLPLLRELKNMAAKTAERGTSLSKRARPINRKRLILRVDIVHTPLFDW